MIFENTAGAALMIPVEIITEFDVAARSSGLSSVPLGKRHSIGANVALEIGRS